MRTIDNKVIRRPTTLPTFFKKLQDAQRRCRITQSVLNTSAHVFPIFFSFFSFFLFFLGGGGGGGGLKLRSYCRKFFHLPYQENMHFLSLRSNYTKNYGTDFHQIWYNGASYQITDLRKIWHFVTSKMRIQEFFFPLHTADAYADVPNSDALTCTLF